MLDAIASLLLGGDSPAIDESQGCNFFRARREARLTARSRLSDERVFFKRDIDASSHGTLARDTVNARVLVYESAVVGETSRVYRVIQQILGNGRATHAHRTHAVANAATRDFFIVARSHEGKLGIPRSISPVSPLVSPSSSSSPFSFFFSFFFLHLAPKGASRLSLS